MRRYLNETSALLSLEDFKKVLNSWNFQHVALHGWGEPLLNPQLFEMIKYAESQGVSTELTTNATLLQTNIEKIFTGGLTSIVFGIHNKKNLPFVIPQINELIRKRDDGKLKKPKIYLDIVIYRENHHEITELMEAGAELKIDEVVLHRVFNIYPLRKPRSLDGNGVKKFEAMAEFKAPPEFSKGVCKIDAGVEYISIQEEKELFKIVKKLAKERKIKLHLPPEPSTPCKAVKHSIFVNAEGKISPCPFLCEFYLGNALNEGIKEVINSKKYINFLRNMDKDYLCGKCPLGSINANFYS
jgi:MoaA/NifB/PqqE/SkfB family radical SAM enzyme